MELLAQTHSFILINGFLYESAKITAASKLRFSLFGKGGGGSGVCDVRHEGTIFDNWTLDSERESRLSSWLLHRCMHARRVCVCVRGHSMPG